MRENKRYKGKRERKEKKYTNKKKEKGVCHVYISNHKDKKKSLKKE